MATLIAFVSAARPKVSYACFQPQLPL